MKTRLLILLVLICVSWSSSVWAWQWRRRRRYTQPSAPNIFTSKSGATFGLSGSPTTSLAISSGPLPGSKETQALASAFKIYASSSSIDNVQMSSSIQSAPSSCSSSSYHELNPTPTVFQSSLTLSVPSSDPMLRETPCSSCSRSLTSIVVSTSLAIKPTKPNSGYPSKTVVTEAPPKEMINRFHEDIKNLNTSEPDCMTVLLDKYDSLMDLIDGQGDVEYNPMTDAKSIEDIALEFTKLHLASSKTHLNISNKYIAFHAKLVESNTDSNVVFPEASEDSDVNTITMPKSLFQGKGFYKLIKRNNI